MVGKLEPGVGQAVIEWRPFNISVGVLTSSRLMLTDARNFTWEVRRIRDGEIVTRLSTQEHSSQSLALSSEWRNGGIYNKR